MKGEGGKIKATGVERFIRGIVPNSVGNDGRVQKEGVGQGDAGDAAVLADPGSLMKVVRRTARLKCLYTNARSLSNKKEELETVMHSESYDIVAISETCGMTPTIGILPSTAIDSLGEIGEVGRVGELLSMSEIG